MIVKTRGGGDRLVESRAASLTGLAAMLESAGLSSRGSTSIAVTEEKLVGLPAANLAVGLAATAIAELELGVFRGKDVARRKVSTTWQARFFAGQPNAYQSWSALLEDTEAALTTGWSAFWRLDLDAVSGRVVGAHFLPRSIVDARWAYDADRPEYRYRLGSGWSEWTSTRVVQFRVGFPSPGELIPPRPVEVARDLIASMLSKPKHARATYEKGAARQLALTFPETVTPEQAELYRRKLEPKMTGSANAGSVRVFGGGATVTTVGLTLDEMQWVEAMQLDAEQIGQLFRVPASLLGVQKSDRLLSPEHEETRWDRYYLGPRRTRIEETLKVSPLLFGPGARDYPAFVPRPIRADVLTTARALVALVQAGIYLPDEARAELGKTELADGVGQIPQITPVGGAPNPDPAPMPIPDPAAG